MSKGQTLRTLVNERLTAAAEEIFALVERTIAEYEEELSRSKEENQRKQRLLDSVLPRNSHGAGVQFEPVRAEDFVPSSDPEEEQSGRREEEELAFIPDILVKGENGGNLSSLFQQQTDHREGPGTQGHYGDKTQGHGYGDKTQGYGYGDKTQGHGYGDKTQTQGHGYGGDKTQGHGYIGDKTQGYGYGEKTQGHGCEGKVEGHGYGQEDIHFKHFQESEKVEQVDSDSESDEDWEPPGGSSETKRMETEDGENYDHKDDSLEMMLNESFSDHDIENKMQTHECLACGETFERSGELQKHMASHVGFNCPVCGKDFTRNTTSRLTWPSTPEAHLSAVQNARRSSLFRIIWTVT
ncbi:hypothetical protein NQD34_002947 [Periophthalmus magnuspinnatus]|nr:hypothetical protein NQD34_002947 [Periophthalmus magnuspinnatus]